MSRGDIRGNPSQIILDTLAAGRQRNERAESFWHVVIS
jgi:hypothetical protein